jgi:uncharacterized protein YdhG (YjbR/CyaY superfamily)
VPSTAKTKNAGQRDAQKVRAYIAALPPDARRRLKQLRATIRAAAPGAAEGVSYGILVFRLEGRPVVWCAGWKNHVSVYPLTPAVRDVYGDELENYETSKGTIRFPLDAPLPARLVKGIVKVRAAEARAAAAKARTRRRDGQPRSRTAG